MSMIACNGCGRICDSDDGPDGWRENRYYCDSCLEEKDKAAMELCQLCACRYRTIYRASDALWKRLFFGSGLSLVCPECFAKAAEDEGVSVYWEVAADRYPTDQVAKTAASLTETLVGLPLPKKGKTV